MRSSVQGMRGVEGTELLRRRYLPKETRVLFVGESSPSGGTFFYAANSNLYFATEEAFLRITTAYGRLYDPNGDDVDGDRARGDFTTERLDKERFEEWKRYQERLLIAYVEVLRSSSNRAGFWEISWRFLTTHVDGAFNDILAFGSVTKWLVADHVASRARELRSIFVQLATSPPPCETSSLQHEVGRWSTASAEKWHHLADSLPSRPFVAWIGAAFTLGAIAWGLPGAAKAVGILGPVLIVVPTIFPIPLFGSFLAKRNLFCPSLGREGVLSRFLLGPVDLRQGSAAAFTTDAARNTYETESDLYKALGYRKPHEVQLDIWAWWFVIFVVSSIALVLTSPAGDELVQGIGLSVAAILAVVNVVRWRTRLKTIQTQSGGEEVR